MTIIHWHDAARKLILPRVAEDAVLLERMDYFKYTEWATLQNQVRQAYKDLARRVSIEDSNPEIFAALERFCASGGVPQKINYLELDLLLTIGSPEHASTYLASLYGPVPIVMTLAFPSAVAGWAQKVGPSLRGIGRREDECGALMRRILVQQDARIRDECRGAVEAVWALGNRVLREQLAVAFLEHEPWRDAVLRDVVESAPPFSNMHLALARDARTIRAILSRYNWSQHGTDGENLINYAEIVASIGEEALPVLFELAKTAKNQLCEPHATAMSVFRCEEVARYLAARISNQKTRYVIGDYFRLHRDLAAVALRDAGRGISRNAALAKAKYVELCGLDALAPGELVGLDDPAVPEILRQAPWERPPPPLPARLSKAISAYPVRVQLTKECEETAEEWLREERHSLPEMTIKEAEAALASMRGDPIRLFHDGKKAFPLESLLQPFRDGQVFAPESAMIMLARFGEKALAGVYHDRRYRHPPSELAHGAYADRYYHFPSELVLSIDDPRFAYSLAKKHLERETGDWPAWSAKYPRAAIVGLLGNAHDPIKRACAEGMLHKLADGGHSDLILELSGNHKRVAEFLARESYRRVWPLTKWPSERSDVAHRPLLRDGRPLGDEVIELICDMLMLSPLNAPYAGLADVKEACEPHSLAEMAWDLCASASSRDQWGTEWRHLAVAHFGDDDVIRRLTALRHPCIYRVLGALASRGVGAGVMGLVIALEEAKARGSESAINDAERAFRRAALAAGKSESELVEIAVPSATFKVDGTTTLQFGTRTLNVGFDTTLAPVLVHDGKRLATLPRAALGDDPEERRLAREEWKQLKSEVETLARRRGMALEDAMRAARPIPFGHFVAGWVKHPLGMHQAHGMIWAVERGGQLVTFRVAHDGTFSDIHDASLRINDGEMIRVPHFAELPEDVRRRWGQILGDYRIIQPVIQLGRVPLDLPSTSPATLDKILEFTAKPTSPVQHTVIGRILREHAGCKVHPYSGMSRRLVRCDGFAQYAIRGAMYVVTSVTLSFVKEIAEGYEAGRNARNAEAISFSKIHPVELAEALYIMRLISEAAT